jgi:DNA-binding CsgD family transcriptional regulator
MDGYKRHRLGSPADNVTRLSPREREVVQLVSEGKASKEIATILNVSLATAETHRSNILRKLRLHSIAELVLYAVRNGIVHVHFPPVLRVPNLGAERNRSRALSGYTAIPKPENGRANVVSEGLNRELSFASLGAKDDNSVLRRAGSSDGHDLQMRWCSS